VKNATFLFNYRSSDFDMELKKGFFPEHPRAGSTDDVEE
jgi:hypothetical protein